MIHITTIKPVSELTALREKSVQSIAPALNVTPSSSPLHKHIKHAPEQNINIIIFFFFTSEDLLSFSSHPAAASLCSELQAERIQAYYNHLVFHSS